MISDSNVFSDEDIVILKHALDFVDEDLCMRWGPQNITRGNDIHKDTNYKIK